ncbi:MAG: substrate-binding domain-containing protein [Spirochaetota bacterium]
MDEGRFRCQNCVFLTGKKDIEEHGLVGKIKIVGPDISPEIRKYIENKTITAEIYQNPILQGYSAVKILEQYLQTGRLPQSKILSVGHDFVIKLVVVYSHFI